MHSAISRARRGEWIAHPAQGSKAKIIGLANAGLDTTNSIKRAAEFGIVKGGEKPAGLLLTLAEVHGFVPAIHVFHARARQRSGCRHKAAKGRA